MNINGKTIALILLLLLVVRNAGGGGGSAPFPTDKLSVLIVEEVQDRGKLPLPQLSAINGTTWRAIVPLEQRRVVDQNVTLTKEVQWVKDALAVKRDSLPWLVISDGKSGFSGPLPPDESALIELLKKYGGS